MPFSSVPRTALLDVVASARPRIVVCWAPAGFGKSVFARQLAARTSDEVFVCDGASAPTVTTFAQALLAALASESPLTVGTIDEGLGTGATDAPDWPAAARAAWQLGGRPGALYLFENIDALEPAALQLLQGCLENLGARELVIICSRTYIAIPFSRRIRPTEVLVLTEHDLRFQPREITELFDAALDRATLERIERLTEGWPLALTLLQRAERLGSLDRLLNELDDVEQGRLDEYIESDIVAPLDAISLDMLCLLTLIDELETATAALALRLSRDEAGTVMRRLPFVRARYHRHALHPLVASYIHKHHAERRSAVASRATDALRAAQEDVLAARIAFAAGDTDRAAGALDETLVPATVARAQIARFAEVFDGPTLTRFPRLWIKAMIHRIYAIPHEQWRSEAAELWRSLDHETPVDVVAGVGCILAAALFVQGDWERFDDVRRSVAQRFPALASTTPLRLLDTFLRAWKSVASHEPVDLDPLIAALTTVASNEYVHALVLCEILAPMKGNAGEREGEREMLEQAIRLAEETRIPTVLAIALQAAAIAAWVAGEDGLFQAHVRALDELSVGERTVRNGTAHFLSCARGEGLAAVSGSEPPATRALSLLIAAATTTSVTTRRESIELALTVADGCRLVQPRILARLAAWANDPVQTQRLAEARALATPLARDSVYRRYFFSRGNEELLTPFLRRFRHAPVADGIVRVHLLEGIVLVGKHTVALSPREFSLLAHIALQSRPTNIEVLGDTLWPNAETSAALASVRVYVNRIRKRLGDPQVIVSLKYSYARGPHVRTDIESIERFVAGLTTATHEDILSALELHDALRAGPPAWLLDMPGFEALHARFGVLLAALEATLERHRDDMPERLRATVSAVLAEDD